MIKSCHLRCIVLEHSFHLAKTQILDSFNVEKIVKFKENSLTLNIQFNSLPSA